MIPADMKVFISHSSKNKKVAGRLCDDLRRKKIEVWLDRDQLHSGDPLIDDLQTAITESTHFLLLWSKPASESRYVKAEWQAAYDLEKVIISCFLDKTPLPLFLRRLKFCDMRGSYLKGWREIIGALEGESPRPKAKKLQTTQPEKQAVIDALYRGQQTVLEILEAGDLARANREQEKLDRVMNDALRRWRSDDVILNLGGYQLKNSYQIKYWDQVSNRRYPYPVDPMLAKAEQLFHAALGINPDDPSAKNGLGSIYWLRGDLDAAEFFIRHAIAKARKNGYRYEEAEQDLKAVKNEKAARTRRFRVAAAVKDA